MEINSAKVKAKIVLKIRNFIAMLPYHLLVMGNVAIFSFIFNKWLEAIIFLTAFFSLRYKFETTYHAKSIVYCMLITNIMFVMSVILSPSIYTYLFGGLLFAYLDCVILWYIQSANEEKECRKVLELRLKEYESNETFKSEILLKCRKAKLSKRDTEIAIKYFVEHNKPKEIWLWLCGNNEYESIEWDSIYRLLNRLANKLNI